MGAASPAPPGETMSKYEKGFLNGLRKSERWWGLQVGIGIFFGIAGFSMTLIMAFVLDQGDATGLGFLVAGVYMILHANSMRGANEFVKRKGLLPPKA